jgi:N6-adenosine-specific RNA methylase IME4
VTAPIVVVADFPWQFGDKLPGKTRGAARQYATMPVEAMGPFLAGYCEGMGNVALFLWRVSSMQEEALRVAREAGFAVKSELVWEKLTKSGKPHFGMGRYMRASHETCLIAVRGRAFPEVRNVRSRFAAPVREHSRKPEKFYAIVERLYPSSEKHELFARTVRAGWRQHGLELGKLGAAE